MRALIAVDPEDSYRPGLHLFRRLEFPKPAIEFVHVGEMLLVGAPGAGPFTYESYPVVEETRRRHGEALVQHAASEASALGLGSTTLYTEGKVSDTLIHEANQFAADLIVTGSSHKSALGAFLLGGVGRGLTIAAHQSLLIAKHDVAPTGKLTVLFATDGSDYADNCLRMLVRMEPRGIRRFAIVTAVPSFEDGQPPMEARMHVDSLVSHLCESGYHAEGHVVLGTPTEVIDSMMQSINADLLVMGAQGHRFIERVVLGSVSMHEVLAQPHSILLLRTS